MITLILIWQLGFAVWGVPSAKGKVVDGLNGLYNNFARFFTFYYYAGKFPVTSRDLKGFSKQDVINLLEHDPSSLLNDDDFAIRAGESAKIFLYFPWAWFHHGEKQPTIRWGLIFLFLIGLISTFTALYWMGKPGLGGILVLTVGSSPTILHEIYERENIFGLMAIYFLLLCALNAPIVFSNKLPRRRWLLLIALFSGVLGAFFREMRTEPALLLLGVLSIYLCFLPLKLSNRVLLFILCVGAFFVTEQAWKTFWNFKIREGVAYVRAKGGHPLPAKAARQAHHELWHPLWCGLGDFDLKYGFQWYDIRAFQRIVPELEKLKGRKFPRNRDGAYLNEYWDNDHMYPVRLVEIPEYNRIAQRQVLKTISSDPVWYIQILAKRLLRILTEVPDIGVSIGPHFFRLIPFPGIFAALAFGIFLFSSFNVGMKLLLISAPASLTALLVTTSGGTQYYSLYPFVLVSALLSTCVVRWKKSWEFLKTHMVSNAL